MKIRNRLTLLLIFCLALLLGCDQEQRTDVKKQESVKVGSQGVKHAQPKHASAYVGSRACAACHEAVYDKWAGSHHELAMQPATEQTVLGDFSDTKFESYNTISRFFRRDGAFMVNTDGPEGKLEDFEIQYTFGVYPLQQYLIAFPGGRLQALSIAWDSRPKEQGGQRWFHLHPDEEIPHDDVLHWTGPNQNWNYMCADCHSTNLKKNYRESDESYKTQWSEISVGCEACHGAGSDHVQWAEHPDNDVPGKGLVVLFDERRDIHWIQDADSQQPRRSRKRQTSIEIETCARCHSRRSQMTDQVKPGAPLMDSFRPALLTEGLYHSDGQIDDEVYVYGSFLQSKMYQVGVTCSDCHDPHAVDTRQPGDQVCYQCHTTERYADQHHHFHPTESAGASCIACHMPPKNFMVVDARHDHSLRIPRPDLSITLGTPNACNQCHTDRTAQWATDQMLDWYGTQPVGLQDYAKALGAARQTLPTASALLKDLISNMDQPAIARATALSDIGAYADREALAMIQKGLSSDDPMMRMGALDALELLGLQQRVMALPLLKDPLRVIRIETARLLVGLPMEQLPVVQKRALERGIEEYIAVQRFNAERPESQVNLGGIYADMGDMARSEEAYRKALDLQPRYVPAYVNLAQLLSGLQREIEAENLLRQGLMLLPDEAALHHVLGLSLVRQKKGSEALESLARAAKLAPGTARYGYVYAVALHAEGQVDEALKILEAAHRRHPADLDILFALASYYKDTGHRQEAMVYAKQLNRLLPGNPGIQDLMRELEAP